MDSQYGKARIDAVQQEDAMYKCTPLHWTLAQQCVPCFHLNAASMQRVNFKAGDLVMCAYGGLGQIQSVRETDFVITLKNWALANGKSPVLYLNRDAFSYHGEAETKGGDDVSIESVRQEKGPYWRECVARAVALKNTATEAFKKGDMAEARDRYFEAINCMQHLGGEEYLPDSLRAEIYEQTVTLNNNIATCCIKTEQYPEVISFARNALLLTRAMKERIGSNVWRELVKRGMSEDKLLKDWQKKSFYLLGKAELKMHEYEDAIKHFEEALKLIEGETDEAHVKSAAELKTLAANARVERKKQVKKDQKTWSKAFKQSSEKDDKQQGIEKLASSPTRNSQRANGSSSSGSGSSSNGSSGSSNIGDNALDPQAVSSMVNKFLKPEHADKHKSATDDVNEDDVPLTPLERVGLGVLGTLVVGGLAYLTLKWAQGRNK